MIVSQITSNAGTAYAYNDTAHKHAVTHLGGVQKFWYDANGNMITRITIQGTYNLTYDQENRLTGVSGAATATFVYDGDGNRVKGTVGTATTTYIGSHFEWTGSTTTMKKYYYADATRVAMREGSTLYYLLGDHLGSTAITLTNTGGLTSEVRYKAFGEDRYTYGTTPTTYRYTGQRNEAYINLYWYNSRWYDPALGRWIQPDSIIPDPNNPLDWDRYSYVRNNPLRYSDPTGHECYEVGSNTICTDDLSSYQELGTLNATLAEIVLDTFGFECGSNCANYVSTVLHAYGLPFDRNNPNWQFWVPDCTIGNWSNAAYLFDYLTNERGFVAIPLPYDAYYDIILPEGTPIFYNNGSYDSGYALNFDEDYRFNHAAVVVGQTRNAEGHLLPVVLDVDNTYQRGKHPYNLTSEPQIIWAVLINVYPLPFEMT